MKFLSISKFLMILTLPILLFLFSFNYYGFDNSFYKEKFFEYNVQRSVPNAYLLHEKVFNFIKGNSGELPKEFNDRESQHLFDVRKLVRIGKILLYVLIVLYLLMLIISAFVLEVKNKIMNFIGKSLLFGGILTLLFAGILLLLINSDFSRVFESFHHLFFTEGTYLFDPSNEIIVNLYPEKLFMDIGVKIAIGVILSAVIIILLGAFLLFNSKSKKNK